MPPPLARILGVELVPDDRRRATRRRGRARRGHRRALRLPRRPRRAARRRPRPRAPVERLAVVGPSGAGKSTLGRLLAGIHRPRTGHVTVGGVPLVGPAGGDLRRHVALVTQEHHVFVGTIARQPPAGPAERDGRAGAGRPDRGRRASAGSTSCPTGWTPWSAPAAARKLTPAQAQQLALARLVLADPHTLVLDEATSLLDPQGRAPPRAVAGRRPATDVRSSRSRTACTPRTTRTGVAVVEGGRSPSYGSHDDLVAAGGAYAALWHSWRTDAPTTAER